MKTRLGIDKELKKVVDAIAVEEAQISGRTPLPVVVPPNSVNQTFHSSVRPNWTQVQ